MDSWPVRGGSTRVGRDLDAIGATSLPPAHSDPAVATVRAAMPSPDPAVHFVRVFGAATNGFADGVDLTLTPSTSELVRWESGTLRGDSDAAETVTFRGDGPASFSAYTGVVSFFWRDRAQRRSASEVSLLVELTRALLEQAQWAAVAEDAEERTAEADLRLIASRAINLAIGALMASDGLSEDDAEQQLRQRAISSGLGLWQTATDLLSGLQPGSAHPSIGESSSATVIDIDRNGRQAKGRGAR